jgi:hypothetical protein
MPHVSSQEQRILWVEAFIFMNGLNFVSECAPHGLPPPASNPNRKRSHEANLTKSLYILYAYYHL